MTGFGQGPQADDVLDPRLLEVLNAVLRQHVQTGEPVGSVAVSRDARVALSPASIRAIMAELEERGLLGQPHPSAGRVPTDGAYRVLVDRMIRRPRVPAAQAQAIEGALLEHRGEVADLLEQASRQLSQCSQQVGLVLAPELERMVLEHLEFVPLAADRVVAILVARSGVVHNRILELDEPLERSELDRAGRYLSAEFGGLTLPEMRERLQARMREERAAYDRMLARSLELGAMAVDGAELDADVFIEGTSNLVDQPEFADRDLLRALLEALEDKRRLMDLLGRVLEEDRVQVVIGEEHPVSDRARCSLVASHYRSGERIVGTVGIVGPTRMPYARAISLVEHLSGVLTRFMSGGRD